MMSYCVKFLRKRINTPTSKFFSDTKRYQLCQPKQNRLCAVGVFQSWFICNSWRNITTQWYYKQLNCRYVLSIYVLLFWFYVIYNWRVIGCLKVLEMIWILNIFFNLLINILKQTSLVSQILMIGVVFNNRKWWNAVTNINLNFNSNTIQDRTSLFY